MIILTGGAGFIGSVLLRTLNDNGHKDVLVVDNLGTSTKWKNLRGKSFSNYLHKDDFLKIIKKDAIEDKIDAVIHLGACSSTTETDCEYLIKNNFKYSRKLCEWSFNKGARFIYASSAATYGNGSKGFSDEHDKINDFEALNMYAYSKQLFDSWAAEEGILNKILGLKFFNVFGPNEYHKDHMMSVVCKAFGQIKETGNLKLFKSHHPDYEDGEQKRDFIYVKDCAEVIYQMLNDRSINGVFNLGTGEARSFNDLGRAVFKALSLPEKIEYIDMPESIRPNYQYYTEADMTKMKSVSDTLSFTSLEDAVTDYVNNYLSVDFKHQ